MSTYYPSLLEAAEAALLEAASVVHNVSREEAAMLIIQRREVGAGLREEAEELLDVWTGTSAQINRAFSLALEKAVLLASVF